MATGTSLQTYAQKGLREDLMDVITSISPEETPMFSSFGKTKANATYHEWQTDALAAAAANAFPEGAVYTFAIRAARTRTGAYTQIFNTPVEVSDTLRAVSVAGVDDEFAYQMAKALKEHARDIEFAICSTGTGASGASGTARQLKGVLSWIATNTGTGATTGTGTGTPETVFNAELQTIWTAGGRPDTVYANGTEKRMISAWTASATKYVNTSDKELYAGVDVYDSDFGRVKFVADRYVPSGGYVVMLQSDMWKVAVLRPTRKVDVAKVGSSTMAVIETELTLESRNEKASGYVKIS
jgi:hypothetical protein